jgi:hypothetical protein
VHRPSSGRIHKVRNALVFDGTSNFFKLRVSIVTVRDTLITLSFTYFTMSLTCQFAARSAVRSLRAAGGYRVAPTAFAQRRWNSTEAATNPKISTIVDQISQLTLLETADLVSTLKARRPLFKRSNRVTRSPYDAQELLLSSAVPAERMDIHFCLQTWTISLTCSI